MKRVLTGGLALLLAITGCAATGWGSAAGRHSTDVIITTDGAGTDERGAELRVGLAFKRNVNITKPITDKLDYKADGGFDVEGGGTAGPN